MSRNLLRPSWSQLDSHELRILLGERIGGPGQYDSLATNPDRLHLPLARDTCRVILTFGDRRIVGVDPGQAFDAAEWERIAGEIETSVLAGPTKIGREYGFCSYRVEGGWRGEKSGVQILPPDPESPIAPVEIAEHPFILEFQIQQSGVWSITNHRRQREHRDLILLLNVLLAGRVNLQLRRGEHFWGMSQNDAGFETRWVQNSYFGKLDRVVTDDLSPISVEVSIADSSRAIFAD